MGFEKRAKERKEETSEEKELCSSNEIERDGKGEREERGE